MGISKIEECLHLLAGDRNFKTALGQEMSADDFAENILGFEEVEEIERRPRRRNSRQYNGSIVQQKGTGGGLYK